MAVAVFFHIHLNLPERTINVNLVDPFAILALATLAMLTGWVFFYSRGRDSARQIPARSLGAIAIGICHF